MCIVCCAGTDVTFTIKAVNDGNMILRNSVLSSSSTQLVGPLVCTQNVDIPVRGQMVCSAVSNFKQDDIEAGDEVFNAAGDSDTLVATATATAQTITVNEMPQLAIDVIGAQCTVPARMRKDRALLAASACHMSQWACVCSGSETMTAAAYCMHADQHNGAVVPQPITGGLQLTRRLLAC